MSDVAVDSELFHRYGDVTGDIGRQTAVAGAVDQAAGIAALVPVFALIGHEYLAAFAVAQANHLGSVAQLSAKYQAVSNASHGSATNYVATEAESATGLTAATGA
jgi:hypothetical protein